jgi:hypothetical protein
MSTAALVARFANTPSWMSAFIAAGLVGVSYTLSSFCTTDPPAVPTFVAQDFVDLLSLGNWGARAAAQAKLNDWIAANIWRDVCMCNSGAQPAYPTPPAAPANLPSLNPPSILPPSGVTPTCYDGGNVSFAVSNGSTAVDSFNYVTTGITPNWIRWQGGITPTGVGPHNPVTFTLLQTHGITPVVDSSATYVSPPLVDVLIPFAPGAEIFRVNKNAPAASSDILQTHITAYCTVAPPSGLGGTPCCPPDSTLRAEIDQILATVNLIQRQIVPFAYVAGTAHTALSGAGTISVQGLLGAKVDITTLPASLGRTGTSPLELFDAGWITWGTADGYPHSVRVEHDPQISLPVRCSAFTSLAYDFHPGVVATITELKREP